MKQIWFFVFLWLTFEQTLLAQDECPRPKTSEQGLYAGVDIGSVGIKPVVFQIEKKADGKVIFRRMSLGLESDNSFDFPKDRSPQAITCLAKRLSEFAAIFRCPLYNVPNNHIFFVMSSGFLENFKNDSYAFADLQSLIKQYNPDIPVGQITAEEEAEYIIRAVTIDGVLALPKINIVDIGGRTVKGGYLLDNDRVSTFSITTGASGLATELESEINSNSWKMNVPADRQALLDLASQRFREKYLPQIQLNTTKGNAIVLGGGIPYMYTAWQKAQDLTTRTFNKILFSDGDADYFAQEVAKNTDNNAIFEKGGGRATIEDYYGLKTFANARDKVYKDAKFIAGAAILRELSKAFRKRGTTQFVFNADMQYAHLYYYVYLISQTSKN